MFWALEILSAALESSAPGVPGYCGACSSLLLPIGRLHVACVYKCKQEQRNGENIAPERAYSVTLLTSLSLSLSQTVSPRSFLCSIHTMFHFCVLSLSHSLFPPFSFLTHFSLAPANLTRSRFNARRHPQKWRNQPECHPVCGISCFIYRTEQINWLSFISKTDDRAKGTRHGEGWMASSSSKWEEDHCTTSICGGLEGGSNSGVNSGVQAAPCDMVFE